MKIHMALTKRDAAIIAFKKALPERKFNETVIKILRSDLKGVMPDAPISFEIDSGIPKTSTKLDLPADLVKEMKDKYKIKKGSFTTVIKKILKEYIRHNRIRPNHPLISIRILKPKFEQDLRDTENVKNLFADQPDKYQQQFFEYKAILDRDLPL